MSNDKHTPTPWTDEKFRPIPAGDDRVLLGAFNLPSTIPLRVLSEANYQHAAKCVNEYDGLIETIATLRAEKAELILLVSKIKESIDEVLEVFDGNGVPNIEWVKNSLLNQSITLDKYESKDILTDFIDWARDCGEDVFYVFDNTDEAIERFIKETN
jgi:hypothetical protein